MMTWREIQQKYPHCWLVAEAIDAYTQAGKRVIDNLRVVKAFDSDWRPAWELYKQVHHDDPQREYYMLHTDRPELDIGVMDGFRRKLA